MALFEVNKLRIIQNNLEKSMKILFKHISKHDASLTEDLEIMENSRFNKKKEFNIIIENVSLPIKNINTLIQNNKLNEITDFSTFKKHMVNIHENILKLKIEFVNKLDPLQCEEDILINDLKFYNKNIDEWSKPTKVNITTELILGVHESKKKQRNEDVQEFLNFIHKSGGHENGWSKEDHELFVSIRRKCSNVEEIAKKLYSLLPDIDESEIKAHEQWYQTYLLLNNRKKNAIKTWKQQKSLQACNSQPQITSKIKVKPKENGATLKEKIVEWKAKKEERIQSEQEMLKLEEQKIKEINESRRKRNNEMKQLINQWKEAKCREEQISRLEKEVAQEKERRMRAYEANRMIKHYQLQDDFHILRMRETKKVEHKLPKSKCLCIVKRDPERLFKPTKQWINRIKEQELTSDFTKVNFVKMIPKLGIPNWRKSLNEGN